MDRFDKFTDRARKVLTLAQDEAQRFNHNYIGTEHLLLGLLRQADNAAAATLMAQGVALEAVRQAVVEVIGPGKAESKAVNGYSERGREVVRGAIALAKQRDQATVAPEDLLLALLQERGGVAVMVLTGLGVDLDAVRQRLVQRLAESSA